MPRGRAVEKISKTHLHIQLSSVMAGELVDKLLSQAAPFKPGYTLGDQAETIVQQEGSLVHSIGVTPSPMVIIAGGLGSFEPRKPQVKVSKL